MMTVRYEWTIEQIAQSDSEDFLTGDIIDSSFADTYTEILSLAGPNDDIGLVRDDDNGRSWAYVKDGKLPEFFSDAFGHEVARVPKRFAI